MNPNEFENPRWKYYHLTRGERVREFWEEHCAEKDRSLLLITARSFDPRTVLVPEIVLTNTSMEKQDVLVLEYEGDESEDSLIDAAVNNVQRIEKILDNRGSIVSKPIRMYASDGRRIASQKAQDVVSDQSDLEAYTDVAIDISGMPRSVFFPLVARVLYLLDGMQAAEDKKNLFVFVAESPELDASISPAGTEEFADFMAGFRGSFDQESHSNLPTVWIPILGEKRPEHLERIYDLVKPNEVSPVLPSPSRDPRRADNLIREYREFLFGQLDLDRREFMFAAENNPFEVYRRLTTTVKRYEYALSDLGGCRFAFSALASKLMSLGVLLAVYELKLRNSMVGVAHVDSQGYKMQNDDAETEIFGLWIAGECYDTKTNA